MNADREGSSEEPGSTEAADRPLDRRKGPAHSRQAGPREAVRVRTRGADRRFVGSVLDERHVRAQGPWTPSTRDSSMSLVAEAARDEGQRVAGLHRGRRFCTDSGNIGDDLRGLDAKTTVGHEDGRSGLVLSGQVRHDRAAAVSDTGRQQQ